MNPLTNVRNTQLLNEKELELGLAGTKTSWHNQFKDSAWVFIGGLPFDLTEGDVICVFSQYGEVVNLNLVRDTKTGKSKGFCFLCYEDQRSTILAVDNLNGIKILGRVIRVDHCNNYKMPNDKKGVEVDEETMRIREQGVAPKPIQLGGAESSEEDDYQVQVKTAKKKKKKEKKEKKHKKKKKKVKSESDSSSESESEQYDHKKQERFESMVSKHKKDMDGMERHVKKSQFRESRDNRAEFKEKGSYKDEKAQRNRDKEVRDERGRDRYKEKYANADQDGFKNKHSKIEQDGYRNKHSSASRDSFRDRSRSDRDYQETREKYDKQRKEKDRSPDSDDHHRKPRDYRDRSRR